MKKTKRRVAYAHSVVSQGVVKTEVKRWTGGGDERIITNREVYDSSLIKEKPVDRLVKCIFRGK